MNLFSSNRFGTHLLFWLAAPSLSAADIQEQPLPPPATAKIVFDRDIRPIFVTSCLRCHGPEKPRSHFQLTDRAAALAGGDENTNDIVPGRSSESLLVHYVARQVADDEMPPTGKGNPLTASQISLLRAWIDQGANWNTTNHPPQLAFDFAPAIREIAVQGNRSKFRELEGVNDGVSGGVERFSVTEQVKPGETVSLSGHATVPDHDIKVALAVDRTDVGFVHGGFEEWRKYYNDIGGYDPVVAPSEFSLNRNLYVDNGRAWVDFGLTMPHGPQIVLGYEYQYKNGNESTLNWGDANGKNIYPAAQGVDEQTHIIKLDVTHTFDDWQLANNARVEIYREKNQDAQSQILFGGTTPDTFVNTQDNYHSVQGMDTLTLEKQIRDWWYVSGGFYYSKLAGNDFFNQTTAIPSFSFANVLSSQQITLRRESEIFSLASLFTPANGLACSLGTQNEWTREEGFGNSVPNFELGVNTPASSHSEEFKASQNADLRFTKIPFTVLFADARVDEESLNEYESEDPDEFVLNGNSFNDSYDLQTGFNTSPWRWFALNAQYERQSSDTDYNYPTDIYNGISGATNGYPGFILNRDVRTDGFETKLDLRPANWVKTTLTYQISDTDYSSKTDPVFDYGLFEAVSPGGEILDGQYHAQTYGLGVTLTPFRRLYFYSAFTYSHTRAVTSDNGDPSLVPYRGDTYTLNTTATYALNAKTSLQASYGFSTANYGENNAAAGLPLGLDFTRHEVIAGLTRQLTKRLTGTLRYQFSQYSEPSSGNANNYTAQGVFAMFAYAWP